MCLNSLITLISNSVDLKLKPHHRVLEIGTGSGYQAAVLAELVDSVFNIEIVEKLGIRARDRLKSLGYDNVEVKIGDGYLIFLEAGDDILELFRCIRNNLKLFSMKLYRFLILGIVLLSLFTNCSSDDADDQSQLPMVFTVDQFLYKCYDVPQSIANFQGSSHYAIAVFTQQPTATKYTTRYTNAAFPNLNFEINWANREEIPGRGAMGDFVPGYDKGIIGGMYNIAALNNGCQETISSGSCSLNGATTQANEQGLRDLGGEMEITIEFQ